MVFSSIVFIFYFLPIVLGVYYLVPKKFKNTVLLLASLVFYFYGEPKYVILMILMIVVTYFFGIWIEKYEKRKKLLLVLSVVINLAFLVYFKYFDFLIKNINNIFSTKLDLINVILPIGISFYTFQIISYIADVYRKEVKAQKNILDLATYVALFPQLVAGPIVRYKTIEENLASRTHTVEKFASGVTRFVIGMGKKVLIANVLGNLVNVFLASNEKSVIFYWLYAIANMLQIYFDFSGYSDMAIGLGKMFGFEFLENFDYPYIARSITEFWRRWHMSLGQWFRDYVYIPLGGNRVGKLKHIRNILVVWLLTGLWHGAEWNFVIWGLYFAIILTVEKFALKKWLDKLPKWVGILYTDIIVMLSFIIFSGNGVAQIMDNLKGLIGIGGVPVITAESLYYLKSYLIVIIAGIIGATPVIKNKILSVKSNKSKKIVNILEPIFVVLVLVVSVSYIVDGSFNPFLYFRF